MHFSMLWLLQECRPSWVLDRRSSSNREEHNLWPRRQRSPWWEAHRGSVQNTRSASCRLQIYFWNFWWHFYKQPNRRIKLCFDQASVVIMGTYDVTDTSHNISLYLIRELGSGMRCRTCRWLTFSPRWLHCQRPTSRQVFPLILCMLEMFMCLCCRALTP